ncbi:unnamed protein product [Victoria cruziana]
MAKPVSGSGRSQRDLEAEIGGVKYKGVRKRKWGRWVSEIRLPNSRERIWLGSYESPEKAARAYDAAVFCLRGRNARFNFPDSPPEISAASSLNPAQIQAAAAQFAHSAGGAPDDAREQPSASESSLVSDVAAGAASESGMPGSLSPGIDLPYLDWLLEDSSESGFSFGSGCSMSFDEFSGEFAVPPLLDLGAEEEEEAGSLGYPNHQPLLWTF